MGDEGRSKGGSGRGGAGVRYDSDVRRAGRYFVLRTGRGKERRSIPLGYVTEEDAQRAVATMLRERDEGTDGRVWVLHERNREAAIRYLLGDPAAAELLPEESRDWSRVSLSDYVTEAYAPWRAETRPKSWRTEVGFWRRILRDLGSVRIRDIDAHVVADYLDGLIVERGERKGELASGSTRRLHRSAIAALLNRAYRQRHILELPELGRFRIEGATKRVRTPKTPLDLRELAALMEASRPKHRAMWAVQAGQGLRPSELLRMRWSDVDLGAQTLDVRGEKTDASEAVIALTPLAEKELAKWKRLVEPRPRPDGFVFPSRRDGSPYAGISGYKRALASAGERAGLDRKVDPYLLRASFATIAWSLGIPIDAAQRITRHTDDKILREVYMRPRPAEVRELLKEFDLEPVDDDDDDEPG